MFCLGICVSCVVWLVCVTDCYYASYSFLFSLLIQLFSADCCVRLFCFCLFVLAVDLVCCV